MTKDIQNFGQINRKILVNSFKTKEEEEENYILYIIKKDFKNSVAQWQCKKKISKLKQILQNKI